MVTTEQFLKEYGKLCKLWDDGCIQELMIIYSCDLDIATTLFMKYKALRYEKLEKFLYGE